MKCLYGLAISYCLLGLGCDNKLDKETQRLHIDTYLYRDVIDDDGMDYRIYYCGHGCFVVNLTKDSLEVELLKRQLEGIDNETK